MDKPGHVSELHVQEIGGSHLATVRLRQLSAGKLKCQRLHTLQPLRRRRWICCSNQPFYPELHRALTDCDCLQNTERRIHYV
jgi:hypothetical protein